MASCCLYRHFDKDGILLYVGISLNAIERLDQHNGCSAWADQISRVEVERFQSRAEARAAEMRAIATEAPLHNAETSQPGSSRLSMILRSYGMTQKALAAELGLHESAISRWANGLVDPGLSNVIKLLVALAVRLSPAAALIRSRIVEHRAELEEHCPEAVGLAAEALATMHAGAWGRMAQLRGSRTARYREAQLSGEHGLPLEDLCCLAIEGPDVVAAGLAVIAAAVGYRLEPLPGGAGTVGQEAAGVSRSGGELGAVVEESLADGRLEPEELDSIRSDIALHRRHLARLEAAVVRAQMGGRP